jgi:hypothetical protein
MINKAIPTVICLAIALSGCASTQATTEAPEATTAQSAPNSAGKTALIGLGAVLVLVLVVRSATYDVLDEAFPE